MQLLRYVDGDYAEPGTFAALRKLLGTASRPAHYLAIPPALFGEVVEHLAQAGCAPAGSRVIVEKPFGRDLASARSLNRILLRTFDEQHIFRIDHYLGKGPVRNMLFFRFTNPLLESFWNRAARRERADHHGGGLRYPGARRFLRRDGSHPRRRAESSLPGAGAMLAMEPPARIDSESIRDEKVKVLKSIAPLEPQDVVRGQFRGYRNEPGVAADSQVETFAALRLAHRQLALAGRALLHPRRQVAARDVYRSRCASAPSAHALSDAHRNCNYLRFRISPDIEVAMGLNVMDPRRKGRQRDRGAAGEQTPRQQ